MFHIVLYQPEIAPNTGNIIRLCANTGSSLHLIEPLGFEWDDKRLRRAGLDYHEFAPVQRWTDLNQFLTSMKPPQLIAFSTKGKYNYSESGYSYGDALLFGPETRGLPSSILNSVADNRILRIPMVPASRSLNLSNAVSIVLYHAWQKNNFTYPP